MKEIAKIIHLKTGIYVVFDNEDGCLEYAHLFPTYVMMACVGGYYNAICLKEFK